MTVVITHFSSSPVTFSLLVPSSSQSISCVLPLGQTHCFPYACPCSACGGVCAGTSDGHDSINDVASWSVVSASASPHAPYFEMPGYVHAGIGNPHALTSCDE